MSEHAFPGLNAEFVGISSDGEERYEVQPSGGMELRDYFAAHAPLPPEAMTIDEHCEFRFRYADAMLKARRK